MPDIATAKKLIESAAAQCQLAAQLADRHAAYALRLAGEVAGAKTALPSSDVLVVHELKAVDARLKEAAEAAKTQTYTVATEALDKAMAQMADIEAAVKRRDELKAVLPGLLSIVQAADGTTPRTDAPSTTSESTRLTGEHQALTEALAKAPVDLKALEARILKARADAQSLKARALLNASGSSPHEVKTAMENLMKESGGEALLDTLIAGMSLMDDPAHVLKALEVRFKLSAGATDEETGTATKAGIDELKRVYKLMADVPAKHTRDNPSLAQVTRKSSGGSAYGGKRISLGDGPAAIAIPRAVYSGSGTPPPNCLGDPTQVPDVDPDCRMDPTATAPKFFDWNVQHEIAHALDDRKGFMNSRAGMPEFGAWQNHGGDALGVATAAATVLALPGIDAPMIAKYLDSGTDPSPLPADWQIVKTWAALTRSEAAPWDKGALATQSAASGGLLLGSRVYHQAYPSHWVSYAAAARKQGVTGYQFRSSGEWFSELYAAYKSKVLKSSHPANTWLDKLFGNAKKTA
jgi:hypothetical protein